MPIIKVFQEGKPKTVYYEEKNVDVADHAYLRARVHGSDIKKSTEYLSGPSRLDRQNVLNFQNMLVYDVVEDNSQKSDPVVLNALKVKR